MSRSIDESFLDRARQRGLAVHDQFAPKTAPPPIPASVPATVPQPGALAARDRLFALGRMADGAMNKTEAKFAAHLDMLKLAGDVLWYAFESVKLKLAPRTFLTVDFAVLPAATMCLTMIDVKGAKAIVQEDAAVKMRVAAGMFPFAFRFAFPQGDGWQIEEI